ncbi:MAG: hypothetical protein NVSMB13_04440 [Mycobacteriales bacterium]
MTLPSNVRVAVVGGGFSGIGTAVRLKQQGIEDFVLLERAGSVGGTWRDNTYPGCACDVPSHLYSFSFAPDPDWSHVYGRQPEIRAYLEKVTDEFGVRPHVHLDTFLPTFSDHDRLEALQALAHVPSVVVVGDKDLLCPLAHAHAIADALPQSELTVFPGVGHMVHMERRQEVSRILLGLVDRALVGRRTFAAV